MRDATDGIASTNPIPLAIPILQEQALPPDRPSEVAFEASSEGNHHEPVERSPLRTEDVIKTTKNVVNK